MSLTHCLCLVVIVLFDYVALESSESEPAEVEKSKLPTSLHSKEITTPATFYWPQGIVPYYIEPEHYDDIIADRIRKAMDAIERNSCVVFKEMEAKPSLGEYPDYTWLSIQNPEGIRECSHTTLRQEGTQIVTKAILIVGYDCMQRRDILHGLLHALGFSDEVTHPQRDMYIRVIWPNIQPKYRSLFWMRSADTPHKLVEYDTMSVMHFHDRAYSLNGGPTIAPLISGLLIAPSDKLSQLDVMKLRLAFGHECNKRKVGNLFQTCQNALKEDDEQSGTSDDYYSSFSTSTDDS